MMGRRRGPGLVGTAARTAVIAGTATAVSGNVSRRQQRREYEHQAAAEAEYAQAAQQPTAASYTEEPAYMAELQKLAQMKSQGIISDQEFEAKKKQILGI